MKNITLLLIFTLVFYYDVSYGQIKVVGGKVGVGTNTPTEKLDIVGDVTVRGSNLYLGDEGGANYSRIHIGKNRTAVGSAGFDFYSQNTGVPSLSLAVATNGRSIFWNRENSDMIFRNSNSNAKILFRTQDVIRMTIQPTGQVDVSGNMTVNGGIAVTSDKRLKTNVKTLNRGLDEVLQLTPIVYHYTGEANTPTHRAFIGIYAQDLQQVAPEFVSKYHFEDADVGNGAVLNEATYLKVHDSELKYLLINAIKEQQTLIEALSLEVAELKKQLNKD